MGHLPDLTGVTRLTHLNVAGNCTWNRLLQSKLFLYFFFFYFSPCKYAAFDGPIPTTLGDLGSKGHGVLDINLKSNKFTGVLPSNIVQLTALEKFDVSNNHLKGELPLLHKLPKLDVNYVNLAGNDFACPMPSEDLVYDTATCTCKAGSKGVKGTTDGELWDPKKCRSNKQLVEACKTTSRFTCAKCDKGKFTDVSWSAQCKDCDKGRFAAQHGTKKCTLCSPGDVQAAGGKSKCEKCNIGRYSNSNGALTCDACAPGFFDNVKESTNCTACEKGKYAKNPLSAECVQVTAGSRTSECAYPDDGRGCANAVLCKPGTMASSPGMDACTSCPHGRYASGHGAKSCTPCASGYVSVVGSTKCTMCVAGTSSALLSKCTKCSPGKFAGDAAAKCTDCAAGQISTKTGSMKCLACPEGKFSNKGTAECIGT